MLTIIKHTYTAKALVNYYYYYYTLNALLLWDTAHNYSCKHWEPVLAVYHHEAGHTSRNENRDKKEKEYQEVEERNE